VKTAINKVIAGNLADIYGRFWEIPRLSSTKAFRGMPFMRRLMGWFLKVVFDAPHETLISFSLGCS
jgi:hypothetical protein